MTHVEPDGPAIPGPEIPPPDTPGPDINPPATPDELPDLQPQEDQPRPDPAP